MSMIAGRVRRNVLWNWAALGTSMVIAFISTPILFNGLGEEMYGAWTLVMSIAGYVAFFDLGMRTSVVRGYAEANAVNDEMRQARIITNSLVHFICVGILIFACALIFTRFSASLYDLKNYAFEFNAAFLLIAFKVAASLPFNSLTGALLGMERYDISCLVQIVFGALGAFVMVMLVLHGYGIIPLAAISTVFGLGGIITMAACFVWITRKWQIGLKYLDWETYKDLAKIGSAFVMISISHTVLSVAGPFIVGAVAGLDKAASFAIAFSLFKYVESSIQSGARVLVPFVAREAANTSSGDTTDIALRAAEMAFGVTLSILVAFCVAGEGFLVAWLNKTSVLEIYQAFIVMTIGGLFNSYTKVVMNVFVGLGKVRAISVESVLELIVFLAGMYILTERYGILGAALAMALVFIVVRLPVYLYVMVRQFSLPRTMKSLLLLALKSLLICAAGYLLSNIPLPESKNVFVWLGICGVCFAFLLGIFCLASFVRVRSLVRLCTGRRG
ncbi:lipopolysaccharide biosynthesis protein [Pseudodesulfovibrio karagichevae]|uniref:Lipopolysaccharide biosynthesis protein n=1 Tax=Pseudodesulfovibrio karagichevae TaxID=3239305 RepID=A0ABV4K4G7_9BACT